MAKVTISQKKAQLEELVRANIGNELTEELAQEIIGIFKAAQRPSTKVNENGEVYCSYFETYLPADRFKPNSKGKFPSMSIEGKKLATKQKNAVNKAINETMKAFRNKEITADELDQILGTIEKNAEHKFPMGTEELPENYPYSLEETEAAA